MSEHTKEPWEAFTKCPGECCWALRSATKDEHGEKEEISFPEMSGEDARRIVACVNACAGISTENLEDNKPLAEGLRGLNERIRQAEQQRDTAWQELREIRQQINANPEEATADEAARVVAQRDKLLAALESLLLITTDSEGVAGYHLNGAVANWSEFSEVNEAALLVMQMKGQP